MFEKLAEWSEWLAGFIDGQEQDLPSDYPSEFVVQFMNRFDDMAATWAEVSDLWDLAKREQISRRCSTARQQRPPAQQSKSVQTDSPSSGENISDSPPASKGESHHTRRDKGKRPRTPSPPLQPSGSLETNQDLSPASLFLSSLGDIIGSKRDRSPSLQSEVQPNKDKKAKLQ